MMCLGENSTSNASWKSVVGVPDQFPAGMRVLVVDDEPICLRILEKMLRNCHYEVTKCSGAVVALKLLRDNRDGFDIVISDVHMPDMDGFKLLEHVGLEMDLPVIMMSADDSKLVVMKGVTHGACDYLIKPVRMEELKNIWQHVVRRKKHEWKEKDLEQSGSVEDGEPQQKPCGDADHSSSANDGNLKNSRKRKDEEDEVEDKDDTSTLKKPRVVWSVELHEQFVAAVNQLGIDKAVPKKILEVMNVPGLTRENVASHLQKYRVYLRRICEQPQNGLGYSFMGPQDSPFGLNGLGFQALASSGQISAQSLATIQAATFTRATNGSRVDQQNIFRFADPNISFLDGQQQNNNGRRGNLLHGIPTNKDSKQLAALHHSAHPFGNVHVNVNSQSGQSNSLLTQLVQPQSRIQMFVRSQSRTQILNEVGSSHALNLPSSVGQPSLSQAIPAAVLSRYGIDNVPALPHASLSQPTSGVEISRSQGMDLPGNTIPLTINSGMPKEILPQELTSEMKVFRSFPPNFEVFNDLNQNRTGYWDLPNVRSSFETSQQGSGDVAPSVLVQPELPSDQTRHIRTTYINKPAFSVASGLGYSTNLGQPEMGFQNSPFSDQFGQQDLMTTLVKQQQGVVPVDDEFRLDDYHLDYLPF